MRYLVRHYKNFRFIYLATLLIVPGSALAKPKVVQLDSYILGRDANHEPCSLDRTWNDARIEKYDRAYLLSCRSVTSARAQGNVVAVKIGHDKGLSRDDCSPLSIVELAGIGKASAQKCPDKATGATRIRIIFKRDKMIYYGESSPTSIGPLETALRTVSGISKPLTDRYEDVKVSLDLSALQNITAVESSFSQEVSPSALNFDPAIVLQNGINLNQRGSFTEASRTLNEGLSRLEGPASVLTQIDFTLEAALNDSNIKLFDSARDHFNTAQKLFDTAKSNGIKISDYHYTKQSTYLALDALNRRQWREALAELKPRGSADKPLLDSSLINSLNQANHKSNNSGTAAISDNAHISSIFLDAQSKLAMSTALWGVNSLDESQQALDSAKEYVNSLSGVVSPTSLLSIKSRIERQYGRLSAKRGDIDQALSHFDCSLNILQGVNHKDSNNCYFASPLHRLPSTIITGPVIADTQLERAELLTQKSGVDRQIVIKEYSNAIESSLNTSEVGKNSYSNLEPYLDILVSKSKGQPDSETAELYFKAVQTIGQPGAARQMAQLQNIVTANPEVGARVRDRSELQRQLVQLRYQLTSVDDTAPQTRKKLEDERRAAEQKLELVESQLQGSVRFSLVDDQLVSVKDVQKSLQNNEYYLKITQLNSNSYGIVIGRDKVFIYRVQGGSDLLMRTSSSVLSSIRDGSDSLPHFDVQRSFGLFALITGPAQSTLASARSVIIDPSGPLKNLPAGILVTSPASVRTYMSDTQYKNPNDYSNLDFWAYTTDISYALSPKSLLVSRSLPTSKAERAFIGFGEHSVPTPLTSSTVDKNFKFGNCTITYSDWVERIALNAPISAAEASVAAIALGDKNAPIITNEAFTDTALMALSEKGDFENYQVIHFATHGIPESSVGCGNAPPSLITTMADPDQSGNTLSDGLLSFSEIAQMRFDANLVVLSACDTAAGVSGTMGRLSGQEESSETLDGLVRSFITAGARSVLATSWQVPATPETEDLMKNFYLSGKSYSISTSLRSAQMAIMSNPDSSHPFFWGAYVLIGDGSKKMLSPVNRQFAAKMAEK